MGFRFRKSIGLGFGRLNFSKSGVSASLGGPGNVVNFGPRGVRHTVGIPGSGLSYSRGLFGRRRRLSNQEIQHQRDIEEARLRSEAEDLIERGDAEDAVHEAKYKQAVLAIKEAEKFEHTFTPAQQAELNTARAELNRFRVDHDQYRHNRQDLRRAMNGDRSQVQSRGVLGTGNSASDSRVWRDEARERQRDVPREGVLIFV